MEIVRYAEVREADPREVLRMVREGVRSRASGEKSPTGVRIELPETAILLNFLFDLEATRDRAAERRGSKEAQREIIDRTLRSVRVDRGFMHSPRQWKSDGQLADESPASLSELSLVLAWYAQAHWTAAFYAHAASNRVGLLRGLGNSIVPQLAAKFIEAVMHGRQAEPHPDIDLSA